VNCSQCGVLSSNNCRRSALPKSRANSSTSLDCRQVCLRTPNSLQHCPFNNNYYNSTRNSTRSVKLRVSPQTSLKHSRESLETLKIDNLSRKFVSLLNRRIHRLNSIARLYLETILIGVLPLFSHFIEALGLGQFTCPSSKKSRRRCNFYMH
jgi:hypothetical protein